MLRPWLLRRIVTRQAPLLVGMRRYSEGQLPTLILFTKANSPCSLCDDAKEILMKYKSEFSYEEQYIDVPGNEAWYDRYKYDIPVMHLDGDLLMMHRVDENKLRTALDKLKTRT